MTIPGSPSRFARGVEEDGFRGRDAMPARDLQSVKVRGCTFGVGFVGHPLDDEAASLASGRHRVEDVDGVGKRGRGRSDGNQPWPGATVSTTSRARDTSNPMSEVSSPDIRFFLRLRGDLQIRVD